MLVTIITGWGHRGRWRELDDWLLIGFIDIELLQLAVDWAETSALYGLCWLPRIRSWGHLGSPVSPVPLWDPPSWKGEMRALRQGWLALGCTDLEAYGAGCSPSELNTHTHTPAHTPTCMYMHTHAPHMPVHTHTLACLCACTTLAHICALAQFHAHTCPHAYTLACICVLIPLHACTHSRALLPPPGSLATRPISTPRRWTMPSSVPSKSGAT